jgi:hypothetical protein
VPKIKGGRIQMIDVRQVANAGESVFVDVEIDIEPSLAPHVIEEVRRILRGQVPENVDEGAGEEYPEKGIFVAKVPGTTHGHVFQCSQIPFDKFTEVLLSLGSATYKYAIHSFHHVIKITKYDVYVDIDEVQHV